jgi:hypothetical protein
MKITALVAALLLTTVSTAYAQGGPDGRMGGPAGGGIEGPAGAGGGAPGGGPDGGGGGRGSDGGGPALRGPEGPGTGGSDAGGPGLGDAPRAAREAQPEREARQPEAKSDRGDRADRPDRGARKAVEDAGDGARKTRKSAEDAGSKAKSETSKAAEKATSDDKPDADQARTKDAAKDADDASKQAKDSVRDQDKARDQDKPPADTARAEKPERAKQVELSGEKRDRVQTALRDKPDVKHRTDVHIDISIGRRLPRDWDFAPLPVAVIEIVPEYRDYVYVWVEEEYLICDPVTYEVVAVIPAREHGYAAASRSGGPSGKCSTRIELSASERELILESVRSGREVDVSDLEIGWSVPSEIALERFPEPVLAEAAELSACRYFVADDQLAIVDPDEDKVVLLIDKG